MNIDELKAEMARQENDEGWKDARVQWTVKIQLDHPQGYTSPFYVLGEGATPEEAYADLKATVEDEGEP